MNWDELEDDLNPSPRFYVEKPDGRLDWGETPRQTTFFKLLYYGAPAIIVYANANAGKRNPMQARREGILAGVFDVTIVQGELVAWIEFKGYSGKKRRQAGRLSDQQIRFGNRLVDHGRLCACFFSPHKAVEWLRENGFDINVQTMA